MGCAMERNIDKNGRQKCLSKQTKNIRTTMKIVDKMRRKFDATNSL